MTPERLVEIRERLERATKGPWEAKFDPMGGYDCMSACWDVRGNEGPIAEVDQRHYGVPSYDDAPIALAQLNATFIAAAPTDIADLLAEVERLTAQLRAAHGYGSDEGEPPWMK